MTIFDTIDDLPSSITPNVTTGHTGHSIDYKAILQAIADGLPLMVTWFGAVGDGVTNDRAAIQAALDFAGTFGGHEVSGPRGLQFKINSSIDIPEECTLSNLRILGAPTFSPVTAIGTAEAHRRNVTIKNVTVDQQATVQGTTFGILGRYVDNFRVEGCLIIDHSLEGIEVQYAGVSIKIVGNIIDGGWGDGIHVGDAATPGDITDVLIDSNIIWAPDCDDGIGVTHGVYRVNICNNIIIGTGLGAGIDVSGCSYITVHNNSVWGAAQHGIRVQVFTVDAYEVEVTHNYVSGVVNAATFGIHVFNANQDTPGTTITIESNHVIVAGDADGGIYTAGTPGTIIRSNRIQSFGSNGVVLDGSVGNPSGPTWIDGNHFVGCDYAVFTGGNDFLGDVLARWNTFQNVVELTDAYELVRITDGSFHPAAFANGWEDYLADDKQPAGYYLDNEGWVTIVGFIKSGTTTVGTTILTLDTGYIPAHSERFVVWGSDGVGFIDVNANGTVVAGDNISATNQSFAGIRFKAGD